MSAYLGQIAALGTAFAWGMTSIAFTHAGRIVGSPIVNRTRLLMAVLMVAGLHLLLYGTPMPLDVEIERWGWLGLSAVLGLVIGDALLFQAFVMIGARLSMLLMALAPVFGLLLGWAVLGETLSLAEGGGILLALVGVVWVITERTPAPAEDERLENNNPPTRSYLIGLLFGLGGAFGQASGLVASKLGLEGDFSALSANMIRLIISTALIWGLAALNGRIGYGFQQLRSQPLALRWIFIGAVAGPFVGISLSLYAVQHAPVGVTSTLMALTPVILLPISHFLYHEAVGFRAVVGTVLAVAGTAFIFLGA